MQVYYGLRPVFREWPSASIIKRMEKKPQQSESRVADKYIVRLPPGMRDEIAAAAKANGRSMNAEIVERIEKASEKTPESLIALLSQLEARATKAEFMVAALRRLTGTANDMTKLYLANVRPEIANNTRLVEMSDNLLKAVDTAELVIGPAEDRDQLEKDSYSTYEKWRKADAELNEISKQQRTKLEQDLKADPASKP